METDSIRKLSPVGELQISTVNKTSPAGLKSVLETGFVSFHLNFSSLEEMIDVLGKVRRNKTFKTKVLAAMGADQSWTSRGQTNQYRPQRRFDRRVDHVGHAKTQSEMDLEEEDGIVWRGSENGEEEEIHTLQ